MRKPPIKVVHLASGDLWAGAEVQLYTLCKMLNASKSVAVKAILLNHGELEKRLKNAGIEVIVFAESKFNSFQIFQRIYKQLKTWQPDVLHTHRKKENILGAIAARINNIDSLRSVHGKAEHHLSWLKPHKMLIAKLDTLVGNYIQKKIVSVSRELTLKLTSTFSTDKLVTVENGVDTEELQAFIKNSKKLFSNKPYKIGLVGRLVAVKRIDRFIEAASILLSQNKIDDYKFLIYGEGPLNEKLQTQIEEANLTKWVSLKGHTNNIHKHIHDLDLLLITSEHEGLPITLLEAMFIGIPVITASVGCIPEVIENGKYGVVLSSTRPNFIAQTISQYCVQPRVLIEMSKEARTSVLKYFSAEKNAANMITLYGALKQF